VNCDGGAFTVEAPSWVVVGDAIDFANRRDKSEITPLFAASTHDDESSGQRRHKRREKAYATLRVFNRMFTVRSVKLSETVEVQ
jgi:hypothetical protein